MCEQTGAECISDKPPSRTWPLGITLLGVVVTALTTKRRGWWAVGCVLRFAKAIPPLGGPEWPFFAAFQRHAGDQATVPTAKRTRPYAFARRTVLLLLSHRRV